MVRITYYDHINYMVTSCYNLNQQNSPNNLQLGGVGWLTS